MNTVSKQSLANIIVQNQKITRIKAKAIVDLFFDLLSEEIAKGNRIEIRGFGSWQVKQTNPQPKARNPRTGQTFFIPARRKVTFKPGQILRRELSKPFHLEE